MLKRLGDMLGLVTDSDKRMLANMTIPEVVDAHIQWKLKLEAFVNGTAGIEIDPSTFCSPNASTTGKWTTLHAAEKLSEFNAFFTLRAKMEQCHHLAGEIVNKINMGDRKGAKEIMNDRFLKTSHELVHALVELEKQLSAED